VLHTLTLAFPFPASHQCQHQQRVKGRTQRFIFILREKINLGDFNMPAKNRKSPAITQQYVAYLAGQQRCTERKVWHLFWHFFVNITRGNIFKLTLKNDFDNWIVSEKYLKT